MVSNNILGATVTIWLINIMMIFSQLAINNMSGNTGTQYWNCAGSIVTEYTVGGDCEKVSSPTFNNASSFLPGSNAQANPTTGFGFVDWIASATSWIQKQAGFFTQVGSTPYNLLMSIPIFQDAAYTPFALIIGVAWWSISILLLVAFIFGR
jgi:hypothetical protein